METVVWGSFAAAGLGTGVANIIKGYANHTHDPQVTARYCESWADNYEFINDIFQQTYKKSNEVELYPYFTRRAEAIDKCLNSLDTAVVTHFLVVFLLAGATWISAHQFINAAT